MNVWESYYWGIVTGMILGAVVGVVGTLAYSLRRL